MEKLITQILERYRHSLVSNDEIAKQIAKAINTNSIKMNQNTLFEQIP